jgi:putative oxidoreductase
VQRLFSVFPEGWPGAGLVLLRGLAALPLLQFIHGAATPALPLFVAVQFLAAICSGFLLIGLWTPVSASLLAVSELALYFSQAGGLSMNIVLAALGAAIAMIGPGAWSVDARLFGRKRIRIPRQ